MDSLYEAVWPKLEKRWEWAEDNFADGTARLLPQEQQAVALWWLEAECNNGSLSQFFFNNSGEFALSALDGLQRLKLPKTYATLHSAIAYFGGDYPLDRERRMDKLFEIEEQFSEDVFDEASGIIIGGADEDYFMDLVFRLGRALPRTARTARRGHLKLNRPSEKYFQTAFQMFV